MGVKREKKGPFELIEGISLFMKWVITFGFRNYFASHKLLQLAHSTRSAMNISDDFSHIIYFSIDKN